MENNESVIDEERMLKDGFPKEAVDYFKSTHDETNKDGYLRTRETYYDSLTDRVNRFLKEKVIRESFIDIKYTSAGTTEDTTTSALIIYEERTN